MMLVHSVPGQDIIHDAMEVSWSFEKLSGVLSVSIVVAFLLLLAGVIWVFKKLANSFYEANKELLASNREIAKENQKQMAKLTVAVNKLTLDTRTDIRVLKEKVDGLEDTIRDRQMMP